MSEEGLPQHPAALLCKIAYILEPMGGETEAAGGLERRRPMVCPLLRSCGLQ